MFWWSVLLALRAGAAEAPAEEVEGLAGAKRQLETVKAAAVPGASTTVLTTPALGLPSLNATPSDFPLRPPVEPRSAVESRPRTNDWITPESAGRNRLRSGGSGAKDEPRSRLDPSETGANAGTAESANRLEFGSDRTDAGPGGPTSLRAVNPLTPFLAGWIAPQDFRLLGTLQRPGENSFPSPGRPGAGEPEPPPTGGVPTTALRAEARSSYEPAAKSRPTPVSPNPYLDLFALPSASPPTPPALPLNSAPAAATAAVMPVAPLSAAGGIGATSTPPATARVPEFLRQKDDEKYYKPLKRF